jgi:DNA replication ATP-dependent helicase Dna2
MYGLQGRLDLLHITDNLADIIELKSSKPFKPNSYGITHSHYYQALLYDLIFSSSDYQNLKRNTYILYSILNEGNLKYALSIKSKQYELLKIRNELVLMDYAMSSNPEMTAKIIAYLKPSNFPDVAGFTLNNLSTFESIFASLSLLEKQYYVHYINFINKEHILNKTGDVLYESYKGQASLWLATEEEKKDRYSILNYLQIIENNSSDNTATIKLAFTHFSSRLSNFRKGDIVVLYPHHFNSANVLKHQIFKCNLIDITDEYVEIRLRNQQKNQKIFKEFDYWNIEQDVLDSSFRHMYKNLYHLISSDEEKRKLILGQSKPAIYEKQSIFNLDEELTNEQKKIINNIYSCKDYFLLWGPPGTGKTSLVIKHLSKVFFEHTNEKVFYIAYTNKAVDEICDAITNAGYGERYLRIGSSYSVAESTIPNLLNEKIKHLNRRKEIVELINHTRIFVSTASSLMGKLELFSIAEFDTIIVDEASQILEPMLCGLLTKFKKFVLIGDHKQLPAVVAQKDSETQIENATLNKAGFYSTKTSLFERLYRQCEQNNWIHSFDILSHQGRMHNEIMKFINKEFYNSKLRLLSKLERLTSPLISYFPIENDHWICRQRMIFINSVTEVNAKWKTNEDEAKKVSSVINMIKDFYKKNNKIFNENNIGIITPYRAQISLIKSYLSQHPMIAVDTVERFQGGAKDIIIISLCTNKLSQLNRLIVKSDQGVDRKLNVALTRAKEQVIVIGNKDILNTDKAYAKLINYCMEVKI